MAIALLSATPSFAESDKTGIDFLRECEGRQEKVGELGVITCASYLMGFLDAYRVLSLGLLENWRTICLPKEGVQAEQAMLVVTKWLRENPHELHHSIRVSILIALKKAFSC